MDLVVHRLRKNLANDSTTLTSTINISGSTFTSASVDIQGFSLYCIQFSYNSVSTAAATLTVQGSADGLIWTDVDSSIAAVSASASSRLLNVEKAGYAYVRIKVAPSTGTVNGFKAIINGKVL